MTKKKKKKILIKKSLSFLKQNFVKQDVILEVGALMGVWVLKNNLKKKRKKKKKKKKKKKLIIGHLAAKPTQVLIFIFKLSK